MTSMASRYFQGRVIETNEPCYVSWDTESRRPEDPAADRAPNPEAANLFRRSPESRRRGKVSAEWLTALLSPAHTHTHLDLELLFNLQRFFFLSSVFPVRLFQVSGAN